MTAVVLVFGLFVSIIVGHELRQSVRRHRVTAIRHRDEEITRAFSNPTREMIAAMREVDAMGIGGPRLEPVMSPPEDGVRKALAFAYQDPDPVVTGERVRHLPVPQGWRRDDVNSGWHGPAGFMSDEAFKHWAGGLRR